MKINFEIKDNHALSFEERHIDLHNNFDFVGLDYNVAEREIKMNWKKSNGGWVDKIELKSLVLTHKYVSFLNVNGQYNINAPNDDGCLGEVTFFPSTARDENDSIMPGSTPKDDDDIIYFFESGLRIRIHCEQIELSIKL